MVYKLRRNPDTRAPGCESIINPKFGKSGNDHPQSAYETQPCTVGMGGGGRVPRTCWPSTDDAPLRYEFGAPPFLNILWISHSIKGRQLQASSMQSCRSPAVLTVYFLKMGECREVLGASSATGIPNLVRQSVSSIAGRLRPVDQFTPPHHVVGRHIVAQHPPHGLVVAPP